MFFRKKLNFIYFLQKKKVEDFFLQISRYKAYSGYHFGLDTRPDSSEYHFSIGTKPDNFGYHFGFGTRPNKFGYHFGFDTRSNNSG